MISRPTRAELVQKLEAAIESRLGSEQMFASNAKAYSRAYAGVADALYSLVLYMHRQQFVTMCDTTYLDLHGSEYGVERIPATYATGSVTFNVSGGGSVPVNTVVQASDGTQYITTSAASAQGVATVSAVTAGSEGNKASGTEVKLLTPISGVSETASITTECAGGANQEQDDEYRQRILQKMRETPMGGAKADYVKWALEVEDVTRAWCYPLEDGNGTVKVRFVCDNLASLIPTATKVAEVQAHIAAVKPVTASVTVAAPTAYPVNFTFTSLTPDDTVVRAQIESELKALFRAEAEPGVRLYLSHIRAAISSAVGETDFTLTSPSADIVPGTGNIPTLGTITWPS